VLRRRIVLMGCLAVLLPAVLFPLSACHTRTEADPDEAGNAAGAGALPPTQTLCCLPCFGLSRARGASGGGTAPDLTLVNALYAYPAGAAPLPEPTLGAGWGMVVGPSTTGVSPSQRRRSIRSVRPDGLEPYRGSFTSSQAW